MSHKSNRQLAAWYGAVHSRRIDIVGDFGGKRLFLIDGDSLMHYCLTTSAVDFEVGFQLLHAVFSVESFLENLRARGCNAHVVFFDNQRELCAPSNTPSGTQYKYQLTRTILIHHLRQHGIKNDTELAFTFPSIDSDEFHQYLTQYPATFLLCHDGHTASGYDSRDGATFHYMIHQFLRLRHSVALIYGTEFKSSRVFMSMITGAPELPSLKPLENQRSTGAEQGSEMLSQPDLTVYQGNSSRELLTAIALHRVLQRPCAEEYFTTMAIAMIFHETIISNTCLAERPLASTELTKKNGIDEKIDIFLHGFCEEISNLLESGVSHSLARELDWDIFDLIDGRLFLSLYANLEGGTTIPTTLVNNSTALLSCVEKWSGIALLSSNRFKISRSPEEDGLQDKSIIHSSDTSEATILPFSHEILNEFLNPVQLQVTCLQEEVNEGRVFSELTHWHNAKVTIDPKKIRKKPGFFALRRTQRFMADTLVYSASLTNTVGKLIEPKIIVKDQATTVKKPNSSTATDSRKASTSVEPKRKHRAVAGKDSARAAALSTQAQKLEKRNAAALQHWRTTSLALGKEENLAKRFQKTIKLFQNLAKDDEVAFGVEVSLYQCDTLYRALDRVFTEQTVATRGEQAFGVGSLLFNQVIQTSRMPNLTEEAAAVLRILGSVVGIPDIVQSGQQKISRPLSFQPRVSGATRLPSLPMATHNFQLKYCGPFLERTFDSRQDDRVPFHPDAWQRSVLDSIDTNDSLLVIAPTSSGKTFISFYAMEKILRQDDDGVLVYVAPTKALVNQIAAEIQARFQKTYHHEGRSVWAIHTRDYRVNNPTGCQILVTVPHVLQIMLLAPSNAKGNNGWSKRIKRIIFDEVHCIGQDDDGLIWEQLLVMAPCPIIALSATVGNPDEFSEWLRISQESKGFKFKMITHHTRFSDLRTFQYVAPQDYQFTGLNHSDHFPVPGLDHPNRTTSNFRFIHPIAAVAHRVGVELDDVSLEARDALTLWESMNRLQTQRFPLDDSLDPSRVFSEIPTKPDVLAWSKNLKEVLATWLHDTSSPFDQVCNDLDPHRKHGLRIEPNVRVARLSAFALLCDLHKENALPALLLNYDRFECESTLDTVLKQLESAEKSWKETSKEWQEKLSDYQRWKSSKNKRNTSKKPTVKTTKEEQMRDEANEEIHQLASFDPQKPLSRFSFADDSRITQSELDDFIRSLEDENLPTHLFSALKRGIAVHHAGMNRRYRQVVEILFRKGYLTAVVATGTLALGINMPCKTVAFIGDSPFLTPLNYKQGAGRAGRRGFDLLGNVVFSNISRMRVHELVSSRLPDLKGHFPLTTTLILRVLGLIDATGPTSFSSNIVRSLLTQNRLYLGGAEAGRSIQHHLRFSIEYLQRQHLLSSNGKPLNFAGLVGHLYFTENAVFAFHSLLKDGYFHRLCSAIDRNTTTVLRTLVLILSHLFERVDLQGRATKSGRLPRLPRLPKEAEKLLVRHNNETLKIFKTYASTFIDQHLNDTPDRNLPFTGIAVGGEKSRMVHLHGDLPPTKLRSPFTALSGHSDDFKSIHDLCTNIRSGVFLEESAVPYIPIWPRDRDTALNSYIYDFFKHGDYIALTRDNHIKKGDVWFLLKDFSLVLATIITSLTNFMKPGADTDDADMVDLNDVGETPDETRAIGKDGKETVAQSVQIAERLNPATARPKPASKKVLESWEDDDDANDNRDDNDADNDTGTDKEDHGDEEDGEEDDYWDDDSSEYDDDDDSSESDAASNKHRGVGSRTWEDGKGLSNVLKAFTMLKTEFDEKFLKTWA